MSYKPYFKDAKGNLVDLSIHAELSDKLGTTTIGSTSEPIFLNDGNPKKCDGLKSMIIDLIYPIGSIFISANAVNPQTLFGGTWEQLKDRFLIGAGGSYSIGATGGEASHVLNENEMPSHVHNVSLGDAGTHTHSVYSTDTWSSNAVGLQHGTKAAGVGGVDQWGGTESYSKTQSHGEQILENDGNHNHTVSVKTTGGGQAHNNMPPYLVVSIWKRTA